MIFNTLYELSKGKTVSHRNGKQISIPKIWIAAYKRGSRIARQGKSGEPFDSERVEFGGGILPSIILLFRFPFIYQRIMWMSKWEGFRIFSFV